MCWSHSWDRKAWPSSHRAQSWWPGPFSSHLQEPGEFAKILITILVQKTKPISPAGKLYRQQEALEMNPAVSANLVANNPHRNTYSRPFLLVGSHDRRIQNHLASSYPSPPTINLSLYLSLLPIWQSSKWHSARWIALRIYGMLSNSTTAQLPFVPGKYILIMLQDSP
jgi:hypothetical protein